MSRLPFAGLVLVALLGSAYMEGLNSTAAEDNCDAGQGTCALYDDDGPWMSVLKQWALSAPENGRQGRIMALPPAKGYYVTDRIDGPMLTPPPLPPHYTSAGSKVPNHPVARPPGARPYDEWQHTPPTPPTTGKIVNRPPNPYKDKFKPSQAYPAPPQNQPIPVHSSGANSVERVDENRQPPQKMVSETDIFLLGAIEKLVWRADLMEKRLRKMEETVHFLVAGVDNKPDPCAENFTRVGDGCYHVSGDSANWKGANYACRRLKANMLEIDSDQEQQKLTSTLISDKRFKEDDDEDLYKSCQYDKCAWLWTRIKTIHILMTGALVYGFLITMIERLPSRKFAATVTKKILKIAKIFQFTPTCTVIVKN